MQKEKLKTQKGITLIALIITIIVMLILVGVSVTVALQGGLFNTAKDAAQKTADAAKQETEMLQYEYEIASAKGETDAQTFTEYVLDTKYSGLEIGDYVDYNESSNTYTPDASKGFGLSATEDKTTGRFDITTGEITTEDLKWRVLGVNNLGQLELISDKPTTGKIVVKNIEGYINYVQVLNEMSNELYGKGQYAKSGRSLNGEDVLALTGYNPNTYNGYGSEHIISKGEDGYIYIDGQKTSNTVYCYLNETNGKIEEMQIGDEPKTVIYNYYHCYSLQDYNNYELLRGDVEEGYVSLFASVYYNDFGSVGILDYPVFTNGLYMNNGPQVGPRYWNTEVAGVWKPASIRPVVTLNSNVTITKDTEKDGSTADNACEIGLK